MVILIIGATVGSAYLVKAVMLKKVSFWIYAALYWGMFLLVGIVMLMKLLGG